MIYPVKVKKKPKIIIVGAGIGGLSFAYKYKGIAEIVVYEKNSPDKLGFPWYDSVKADAFSDTKIPLPTDGVSGRKKIDMFSPGGAGHLPQREKTVKMGYEIDRVSLIKHLLQLAGEKATIVYGREVTGLIKQSGKVVGVIFKDGSKEECDLVLDACGPFSCLRKFVCDNEQDYMPLPEDILYCKRGMYRIKEGVKVNPGNEVYIKHMGGSAISWCRHTPEGKYLDVFISSLGKPLTEEYLTQAMDDIRMRNGALSEEVIVRLERLSLRYPLSQMVYDGYAAVGDSAYATNPVSGCGIDSAMRAGSILAETINTAKNFSVASLWDYQSRFMRSVGSTLIALDVIKRWLDTADPADIDWLFGSVIGEEIVTFLNSDNALKNFNPKMFLDKIPVAFDRKDLLSEAFRVFSSAGAAKAFAMLIPPVYNKKAVLSWRKKYDSFVRK